MKRRLLGVSALALLVAGCGTTTNLPAGAPAYEIAPAVSDLGALEEYRIRPPDRLSVLVFREPDLSIADIEVDRAGRVAVPLIGPVLAAGKTTDQVAADIKAELSKRYLVNPEVTVYVSASTSQRVIVDGTVVTPGIYDFKGRTTLLGALALARGPGRTAKLNEVAIFRFVNGQRMGAKFDVAAIRHGEAPDPEVLANDTIVVGFSGIKAAWRDFLTAVPVIGLFRPLYD